MEHKPILIENIELDQVAVVDDFCEKISFNTKREQLDLTRSFLQANLKNLLTIKDKVDQAILERIWDQKTIKKLSTVFDDKYGVCLEWHVVAQVVLNKVGIEAVFRTGQIPNEPEHTYLDVKIDGRWEVFDPFAENYLKEGGYTGSKFQDGYYTDSFTHKQK